MFFFFLTCNEKVLNTVQFQKACSKCNRDWRPEAALLTGWGALGEGSSDLPQVGEVGGGCSWPQGELGALVWPWFVAWKPCAFRTLVLPSTGCSSHTSHVASNGTGVSVSTGTCWCEWSTVLSTCGWWRQIPPASSCLPGSFVWNCVAKLLRTSRNVLQELLSII